MRRVAVFVLVSLPLLFPQSGSAAGFPGDPARLVDPFVGTARLGNTFPGATVPFGMVQFSPVSVPSGPGGYVYGARGIRGFSLTRVSGAGCRNYGDLPLMPTTAPVSVSPAADPSAYVATFDHTHEAAAPGSYGVALGSGIDVSLTATPRSGLARFVFPAQATSGSVLLDPGGSANPIASTLRVVGNTRVVGSSVSRAFGGDCGTEFGSYTLYFFVQFSRPFRSFGSWQGAQLRPGGRAVSGRSAGAYLTFDTSSAHRVRVKVGISFVSIADAALNLRVEQPEWSLQRVAAQARASWDAVLRRARVAGGTRAQEVTFETALYHSLLHPNVFSDVNGSYRGRDGRVHVARGYVRYTNFSGWDVYRCEIPLLALLVPGRTSDMLQSLVTDAQEAGHLAKWLLADVETGMMVGDPADAIIAGGYAFGADRFDAQAALREMVYGATVPQPGPFTYPSRSAAGYVERPGLDVYLARGYIPVNNGEGVIDGTASTTLEYGTADFAIAQLAAALGDSTDATTFSTRAESWKNLFNPATRLIQPRLASGVFVPRLGPASQFGFVEGNAAQYSWMVPYDLGALLAAMGSRPQVLHRLDGFFRELNAGRAKPYAWFGNEPSIDAPWAYLWLAAPWRTQDVVRRIDDTLFRPTPGGLPGNDDLGAMSSWYVWSALGLYPAIPGVGGLAVGSPLFPRAAVLLPGRGSLRIAAAGASARAPYVQSLTLDGAPFAQTWLPLSAIAKGGALAYRLGTRPNRAWASSFVPPSLEQSSVP